MEDIIGTRDAAKILEITPSAVVRLINRASLAARWQGVWLIKKTEVERLKNDPGYQLRTRRHEHVA